MAKNSTILRRVFFLAAISLSFLQAFPAVVGDVVDLTSSLKGKVYKVNGSSNYVEVYQNPDNLPKGSVEIKYMYTIGGENYVVDKLADSAFRRNSDITSVSLNASITTIPASSFRACTKLSKVDFEKGQIQYIGSYAFEHTSNLESFDLSGVISLSEGAFWVSGLKNVELPSVSYIGQQAFREMKGLTKVVVGPNCHTIEGAAFASCDNLGEVTLNYGVKTIGVSNFSYSYELNDLVVPATVTSMGKSVTGFSAIKRLFILSPDFMNFCEESNILEHPSMTEIYTLDALIPEIDYFLSINSTTNTRLPKIKAKSLSELVEVVSVKGESGKFTILVKNEEVDDVKVLDSSRNRIYPDKEKVFSVTDGGAFLSYTVAGFNNLEYPVEIKDIPEEGGDDNNGNEGGDTSGIDVINSGSPRFVYYNLQGMMERHPKTGRSYIRKNLNTGKVEKIMVW